MKTIQTKFKHLAVLMASAAIPAVGWSMPLVIDEASDSYTMDIGDFSEVSGTDIASSPGQVEEILQLFTMDPVPATGSASLGDIWTLFNDNMVSSATQIVMGLGVNETMGSSGFIILESLEVDIDTLDYDWTGGDLAQIFAYGPGGSQAEALFTMDLGFDFMTTYNAGSTELFSVTTDMSDRSDGFEIFFLSSAFQDSPEPPFCEQFPDDPQCDDPMDVPEPGSLALLGLGLLGMGLGRRQKKI